MSLSTRLSDNLILTMVADKYNEVDYDSASSKLNKKLFNI